MHVIECKVSNRVKKGQERSEIMEAAKISTREEDNEEDVTLPGFRFHPTDEELVGFYLRRKVENKTINIELIKQIDIYKYDPWDLPKVSTVDDKEWYYFCMRGRKYKKSVRPNRVTKSGFWKATGIDKPVYSSTSKSHCIGLKKTLVYYRGSAGKGTKTDWMMHEFRLPPTSNLQLPDTHEAEVWTLCRILERTSNYKRYTQEVKHPVISLSHGDESSKACSLESENSDHHSTSFKDMSSQQENYNVAIGDSPMDERNPQFYISQQNITSQSPFTSSSSSSFWNTNSQEEYLFSDGNKWDELKSIVDLATDPSIIYRCR